MSLHHQAAGFRDLREQLLETSGPKRAGQAPGGVAGISNQNAPMGPCLKRPDAIGCQPRVSYARLGFDEDPTRRCQPQRRRVLTINTKAARNARVHQRCH